MSTYYYAHVIWDNSCLISAETISRPRFRENLYYPQYMCQSLGSQNNGLISLLPKAQCSSLQQKRLIRLGIRQSNVLHGLSGCVASHWLEFYFLDSIAYEKLVSSISNERLKKGIMKASPIEQTSCLEGFHSILNQFSKK